MIVGLCFEHVDDSRAALILSLLLLMACDDSDGCVMIAMAKGEIYVKCGRIVGEVAAMAGSQNRLNSKKITIYGSDLLILLAYAPSMPPLLSLPLHMACDDSDGLNNSDKARLSICIVAGQVSSTRSHVTVNEAVMNQTLNRVCRGIKASSGAALVRLLPWLAYSQNRLNSKKVFCSHIDISEPNKLNYEGNDEFIGKEEQRQGGLHLGVSTY
ncbi:hypothetical protein Tco_0920569 [Tanacetum coccineum]